MSSSSDEELMQHYAAGNAAAFDVLYQRHRQGLYRYLLRQCDEAAVDELYQEVWMKLIRQREGYRPTARFATWLYTLAHGTLVDWYRKQSHRQSDSLDDEAVPEPAAGPDWEPHNELDRQRLRKALRQAVAELPAGQREVFLLHQEGGFSVNEVATIVGIGSEAAKSRYRYALRRLRQSLERFR